MDLRGLAKRLQMRSPRISRANKSQTPRKSTKNKRIERVKLEISNFELIKGKMYKYENSKKKTL